MDETARQRNEGPLWILRGPAGLRVGVRPEALTGAGVPLAIELPRTGQRVVAGAPCVLVDASKTAVDLEAPVSGVVVAVNERLVTAPEVLAADPLGEGWLYVVRPDEP